MDLYSHATDAMEYALKEGADYVDIRVENSFENKVELRNNAFCGVNTHLLEAIGIRALFNGFWGFAATASLDTSSIKNTVEKSLLSAKKIASLFPEKKSELASITVRKTSVADDHKIAPQLLNPTERTKLLSRVSNRIYSEVKELKILDLKLTENQTQKIFMSSEGSEIEQVLIRANMFIGSSTIGSNNVPKVRTVGFGGVGGIEQFEKPEFELFLNNFTKTLPKVANSKAIKPLKTPAILNEEMGWNLCHEFCHAVESDLILNGRSPLGSQLGKKIGSELVTIIDDASFKGFGEYYFDDEGVKASGTLIVEDGILFDTLQNRETAIKMSAVPTSNGRAENSLFLPEVRQSNTFFEPGNCSFDELIEDIKDGIYICDSFGGIANTLQGNFQLDAQYGRRIVKGKLTDYVSNFALVGNLYTILGDISGMTKEIGSYPAYCGKNGQHVAVGAISPKVKLDSTTIVANIAQKQIRKIDFSKMRER